MVHRAFDHLDHMIDLRSMRARDKRRPGSEQFLYRVDRLIDRSGGVGLGFVSDGRRGRRLLFCETVNKIVHDNVGHPDILSRTVIEMIAAD